jgi:serine/threonine protein kinase
MRRSPPTMESAVGLELELQELAAAVAVRNESAGLGSVQLLPKENIPLDKLDKDWPITCTCTCSSCTSTSTSTCRGSLHHAPSIVYQAVEGFVEFVQVEDEPLHVDKERHLYSVKRLCVTKKAAHHKEAIGKALKRLVREASILTKLGDQPNIVSLLALPSSSLLTADQDFFIVTRRLHKETLEDRIHSWRKQEVPNNYHFLYTTIYARDGYENDDDTTPSDDFLPRKSSYAFQIATAIRACHKAGIILKDLSPSNVGFRYDDPHCVQLFDLGYAQDTHSSPAILALDHKEPLCGKRRYMAGRCCRKNICYDFTRPSSSHHLPLCPLSDLQARFGLQGNTPARPMCTVGA